VTPNASVAVYLEFQWVSRIDDSGPSFRQKGTRVQHSKICAETTDQPQFRGFCFQTVRPLIRTSSPLGDEVAQPRTSSAGSLPLTHVGGYDN